MITAKDKNLSDLEKEELRLLKLLKQNVEAQLLSVPNYCKYLEISALIASRSDL